MSLICTPMRTDQAARDIRKKKTEYVSDAAQRARIGQIEDASQRVEYQDVLQQEADLTAGHGVLRYTGLLSVSAPTVADAHTALQGADGDPARRQNRDDDATARRTRIVRHDKPHDDIDVTVCVHDTFTESIVSTKRH